MYEETVKEIEKISDMFKSCGSQSNLSCLQELGEIASTVRRDRPIMLRQSVDQTSLLDSKAMAKRWEI